MSQSEAPASGAHDASGKLTVWKRFTLSVSLVTALFVLGIFIGIFLRNREVMQQDVEARARSYFHNILLMRQWNASYGGVYVEKGPGVESNPYLENADITGSDGKVYTKKNPALMTREISELADKDGMFTFRITSLKPLNPHNEPDEFEHASLAQFEAGKKENMVTVTRDGRSVFRYMAPLLAEETCLSCHAKQGYKAGDIRGGISVSFDVTAVEKARSQTGAVIMILCVATLVLLLGILYFFIFKLMRKLREAHDRLEALAMTDPLTGLANRRYFFQRLETEFKRAGRYGTSLACLLVDVDHFKLVNDKYGHQTGDDVLGEIAGLLAKSTRSPDVAARFGGEEFILLLPETGMEGARHAAAKLQKALRAMDFTAQDGTRFKVTASFGCAAFEAGEAGSVKDPAAFIHLADKALYLAKASGRDQVRCSLEGCES
jgi:diguanylate cyclase (GGDEF)-like protein